MGSIAKLKDIDPTISVTVAQAMLDRGVESITIGASAGLWNEVAKRLGWPAWGKLDEAKAMDAIEASMNNSPGTLEKWRRPDGVRIFLLPASLRKKPVRGLYGPIT